MATRAFHQRLERRWPIVMAEELGCTLIEAGLGGRTVCNQNPQDGELYLDGPLGLRIALLSSGPIDTLVIMLGTNDLQTRHGRSAEDIRAGMSKLLSIAHDAEIQARHANFDVLVVCPPAALETGTFSPEFDGAAEKTTTLPALYADLAKRWGDQFFDAGTVINSDPLDAVHFGEVAHRKLGLAIAKVLAR
jgi:lysophospholipase L1-like esterase